MKLKANKLPRRGDVGSSAVLDLIMQVTVVCACALMIPMLIMLLILLGLSISKKCQDLDNVPKHSQTQSNPHTANARLIISGELWCLRDQSMPSVGRSLNFDSGLAENLDGFVGKKHRSNSAESDSDSCDVFGTHSAMRSNEKS